MIFRRVHVLAYVRTFGDRRQETGVRKKSSDGWIDLLDSKFSDPEFLPKVVLIPPSCLLFSAARTWALPLIVNLAQYRHLRWRKQCLGLLDCGVEIQRVRVIAHLPFCISAIIR